MESPRAVEQVVAMARVLTESELSASRLLTVLSSSSTRFSARIARSSTLASVASTRESALKTGPLASLCFCVLRCGAGGGEGREVCFRRFREVRSGRPERDARVGSTVEAM